MADENHTFADGKYYHVANFGIDNHLLFNDKKDIDRFTSLLDFYKIKNPSSRFSFRKRPTSEESEEKPIQMVEVLAYCLMPTHYHLLLKQIEVGIGQYLSKISNSYTKYYNSRQKRKGPLFLGTFKSHEVEEDKLSYLSRHLYLEPKLSEIVNEPSDFPFSSLSEYLSESEDGFCEKGKILEGFSSLKVYEKFVIDQDDYKTSLPQIKDLLLE